MRAVHLPVWLGTVGRSRATTFATLFMLVTFGRGLLVTVIPITAHSLLGNAQKVSLLYFSVSILGVVGAFAIPWLVHSVRRRRVFTFGAVGVMVAAALFASGGKLGLYLGLIVQVFSVACLEITFNLYLMDHIPRNQISRFEPMRVFFTAFSWTLGPWLGVFLRNEVAPWAPFLGSGLAGVVMLAYFWYLRLSDNPAVVAAKSRPPRPVLFLPRYFRQPRLRLAWLLAFGRSAWWGMFFVYAPIYFVSEGVDEVTTGALISLGSASVLIVPLWGWVARRIGMQKLLIVGYLASGVTTLAVAMTAGVPWVGVAVLVLAAFGTGIVDGAGNTPFLRAVRPLERAEMTTVFATYRDAAQLAPPGIFALLLRSFELPVVFLTAGAGMLVLSWYSRYLPRRL